MRSTEIGWVLAFAVTAALTVVAPSEAMSTDLSGDVSSDYEPPELPSTIVNHWYVGARGGATFSNDTDFGIAAGTITTGYGDPGFFGAGIVGYDLSPGAGGGGLRVEAELAYLIKHADSQSVPGLGTFSDGAITGDTTALMGFANAYYDVPFSTWSKVFLGGGIGLANVSFNNHGTAATGQLIDTSATAFAWHLTSGVAVTLAANTDLEFGYRFLNISGADLAAVDGTTSSVDSTDHILFAGVRYRF